MSSAEVGSGVLAANRDDTEARAWIGVRTPLGRVIHWYAGDAFDGPRFLFAECGLSGNFAVDRDSGHYGPRLDDYCARCDAAIMKWVNR